MHCGHPRFLCLAAAALVAALGVAPARADLVSAQAAYAKHDFPTAFAQYRELAELGQPVAQFDLAVMYARGEGTDLSMTQAHAWASLAASNGDTHGAALAQELAPKLTPTSLRISAGIQDQFSQAALDRRLLPHVLSGRDYEDHDPVRRLKPYVPAYPLAARNRGVQGHVFVEFTVAPDGHPRNARILFAVPRGYFEDTVRESVMRSVYLPARHGSVPVAENVSVFYNFVMEGLSIRQYEGLEQQVRSTATKAEAGDPQAQMLYGMMIAGLPQLNQTYDRAIPWFLKAAQAGAPYAQYQIGTGLLRGHGCQCDLNKGEVWLQKAAAADQPDAQVSLAEYLLRDFSSPDAVAGALVWLERAQRQGSSSARLLLASILAAYPDGRRRDPARALALAEQLDHDFRRDPSLWEIRAAALAGKGDYRAAARAEAHGMDIARDLGWDLTALRVRADAYAAQQVWTGNLLAF